MTKFMKSMFVQRERLMRTIEEAQGYSTCNYISVFSLKPFPEVKKS